MTGYKQAIMDATGVSEDDVAVVEGIMREDNRGVLDDLTERQFDRAAQAAHEALLALEEEGHHDVVDYYRQRGA